jgi:hypothetical protein
MMEHSFLSLAMFHGDDDLVSPLLIHSVFGFGKPALHDQLFLALGLPVLPID